MKATSRRLTLTEPVQRDLRDILGSKLTESLDNVLAQCLDVYRFERQARPNPIDDLHQYRDAAQRLVKAGEALLREQRRSRVLFTSFAFSAQIDAFTEPVAVMVKRLKEWQATVSPLTRRRGNPQRHQWQWLRIDIMCELPHYGVPITKNANGTAAKIVARLLEEADRLDGKLRGPRAPFNGTQWARWVDEAKWGKTHRWM